jgi:hypothetical protein
MRLATARADLRSAALRPPMAMMAPFIAF